MTAALAMHALDEVIDRLNDAGLTVVVSPTHVEVDDRSASRMFVSWNRSGVDFVLLRREPDWSALMLDAFVRASSDPRNMGGAHALADGIDAAGTILLDELEPWSDREESA